MPSWALFRFKVRRANHIGRWEFLNVHLVEPSPVTQTSRSGSAILLPSHTANQRPSCQSTWVNPLAKFVILIVHRSNIWCWPTSLVIIAAVSEFVQGFDDFCVHAMLATVVVAEAIPGSPLVDLIPPIQHWRLIQLFIIIGFKNVEHAI